jgi:hypothetical protein
MNDSHHTVYFEVQDALAEPGCALCRLALRSLHNYFDSMVYESVNDPGIRDDIRAAHGFCEVHGRMLREAHDALGTAIIHRDVLRALDEELSGTPYTAPSIGERLAHALLGNEGANHGNGRPLAPKQPCPACAHRASTDQVYVSALMQHLTEAELLPLFQKSAGLCQPHLRLAIRAAPDTATFERLQAAQRAIWQRLVDELDEFIRKHDHRFSGEAIGAEGTSWSRAIDLVSGQLGLGCQKGDAL